uniref:Uncharacterized protein n=2 Tax=Timema TaxID=61471 RepID=A0A7R9NZS3_9NEOP|nr:unnamed protein product [Timema bartmani]CAD7462400.1 unnamed protein product [Timema tahoe]
MPVLQGAAGVTSHSECRQDRKLCFPPGTGHRFSFSSTRDITRKRGLGLTTSWNFFKIGLDGLTRFYLLTLKRLFEKPGSEFPTGFGNMVPADSKLSAATKESAMPYVRNNLHSTRIGIAEREVIAASGCRKVPILRLGPRERNQSFLKVGYPVIVIPRPFYYDITTGALSLRSLKQWYPIIVQGKPCQMPRSSTENPEASVRD